MKQVKQTKPTGKIGLLLTNVGTPQAPNVRAVRQYLAEFLTDPRVVSLPKVLRYLLVYGLILPFRTKKSTQAYQAIWDNQTGSPLLSISRAFENKLQAQLGDNYCVALGMRYGQPSIESAIKILMENKVQQIIMAPLYPQYASATTSSALEKIFDILKKETVIPPVSTLDAFYYRPEYINAKADIIKPYLQKKWDGILLSYHGLPFDQIKQSEPYTPTLCDKDLPCPAILSAEPSEHTNCYRAQCYQTSSLLAHALNLNKEDYMVGFQSRVGMNRWIGPDTSAVLKTMIGKGKKNLLVVCPSFVADCLETVEEINIRAKALWQSLGGESLTLVPCLNDSPEWVDGFASLIQQQRA